MVIGDLNIDHEPNEKDTYNYLSDFCCFILQILKSNAITTDSSD